MISATALDPTQAAVLSNGAVTNTEISQKSQSDHRDGSKFRCYQVWDSDTIASEDNQPITVVIKETVKPDKLTEFKRCIQRMQEAQRRYQGFVGVKVICPKKEGTTFITVLTFDSCEHLNLWSHSEDRAYFLRELLTLLEEGYTQCLYGLGGRDLSIHLARKS